MNSRAHAALLCSTLTASAAGCGLIGRGGQTATVLSGPAEAPVAGPAASARPSARVFYLGHSLVGHELPQMVGTLAASRDQGYVVRGQVGWGTSLLSHWDWSGEFGSGYRPPGFAEELPGTLLFEAPGREAVARGAFDTVVLTETNGCVEGKAGAWRVRCGRTAHDCCTLDSLADWARLARANRPQVRLLFYGHWKNLPSSGPLTEWVRQTREDLGWWRAVAAAVDAQAPAGTPPIEVIPGGVALADVVAAAERGELASLGVASGRDLFTDGVHLTRLGFYVLALVHYAAIFQADPTGLPGRVDVTSADHRTRAVFEVSPELAARLQALVLVSLREAGKSRRT